MWPTEERGGPEAVSRNRDHPRRPRGAEANRMTGVGIWSAVTAVGSVPDQSNVAWSVRDSNRDLPTAPTGMLPAFLVWAWINRGHPASDWSRR
jgi:hypothetical protein